MAGSIFSDKHTMNINQIVTKWLYPKLRELPPEVWDSILCKARGTKFDTAEYVGIVGSVAFVAWLLGSEPSVFKTQSLTLDYVVQFVLALPLLACLVGPFNLRRTRRGLDRELLRRKIHTADLKAHPDREEA